MLLVLLPVLLVFICIGDRKGSGRRTVEKFLGSLASSSFRGNDGNCSNNRLCSRYCAHGSVPAERGIPVPAAMGAFDHPAMGAGYPGGWHTRLREAHGPSPHMIARRARVGDRERTMRHCGWAGPEVAFLKAEPRAARPEHTRAILLK